MEGKIYEEVIFNEQWRRTYDDLESNGHSVERGLFLPIQIKTMIEAGLWTLYTYNQKISIEKEEEVCGYLDDLIENGSAFDDLYVEYVTKLPMNHNASYCIDEDDIEEMIAIFFIRHNITIDNDNKVIFKHPLRYGEIKDYHDLMRCFPVNWDGFCEIMNHCYDYNFNRYRSYIPEEEQKDILEKYKGSSFMVYWYWTDMRDKKNSKRKREKEVRLIEVLNQRSCQPMKKDDVNKYLDKRIE